MSSRRTLAVVAIVLSSIVVGSTEAQNRPSKGEQALKYRKAVYQTLAWNFGPLAAMAQDKIPFDAHEFALRAERVAFLAPLLEETYGPETRNVGGSKLKPEMWNQRADFDQRLQAMIDRTGELVTAAKTGDAVQSKTAFVATANACKGCHDKYRAD
jgi:cytochrome c556